MTMPLVAVPCCDVIRASTPSAHEGGVQLESFLVADCRRFLVRHGFDHVLGIPSMGKVFPDTKFIDDEPPDWMPRYHL